MGLWRVGRSCPRNLYEDDVDVGRCDDPKVSARIALTMNERARDDAVLRVAADLVEAAEQICKRNPGSGLYEGLGQAANALRILLVAEGEPPSSGLDRSNPVLPPPPAPPIRLGGYAFAGEPAATIPPVIREKEEPPMDRPPEATPPMGRRPLTESGAKRSLIAHYRRVIGEEGANIRTCDDEIRALAAKPEVVRYLEAVEARRVSVERRDQAAKDLGMAVADPAESGGAIGSR